MVWPFGSRSKAAVPAELMPAVSDDVARRFAEHQDRSATANFLASVLAMNNMPGEHKTFDWIHYQAMTQGGAQAMFQGEFNLIPTIRVMKGLQLTEPWISHAVNAVVRTFMSPRLILKRSQTSDGQMQIVRDHKFLSFMRQAGSDVENRAFFIANRMADGFLTGNAYFWTPKDRSTKRGMPSERIEPIITANKITAYRLLYSSMEYDPTGIGARELPPDEVTHIKFPNPFSPHVGLSPLISLCLPVLIDKYGLEYIIGFFLRGGNTAGIIETKTTNMEALLRLSASIMQAFGGRRNMHADKILPDGATWKGQGNTFAQIGLIEVMKQNIAHFRAATGCTNAVLGLGENTSRAQFFAEMEQFYLSTVLPFQQLLCACIENTPLWYSFGLDDSWELAFDNSTVPYLDDFDRKLDQDAKLAGTWTLNERRQRLGKDPMDGGDALPSKAAAPAPPTTFALVAPVEPKSGPITTPDQDDAAELVAWKAAENDLQEPPTTVSGLFQREIIAWESIVLEHMQDKAAGTAKVKARADSFAAVLASKATPSAMQAYDNQIAQLKKSKSWTEERGRFVRKETAEDRASRMAALRERAEKVIKGKILANGSTSFLGYSQTAMDRVYTVIQDALENGKSLDDAAAAVRQEFGEIYEGQAQTITRTEYGAAVSYGQSQFGQDLATVAKRMSKAWITLGDEHVRTSHQECEDQGAIGGDSEPGSVHDLPFTNGLRYPRDEDGDAADVINCRCTIRWQVEDWGE